MTRRLVLLLGVLGLLLAAVPATAQDRQAPPTGLRVTVTGPGTATLSWQAAAGAAGYNVYRDGDYATTVHSTSWDDETSASTHRWYVTAFDEGGGSFSERSTEVEADLSGQGDAAPDPEPSTVGTPTIIHARITSSYVEVKWRQVASAVGVNVYRNDQFLGSVNFPDNVFIDRQGGSGDAYHLVAYDGDRFSEPSAERRVYDHATIGDVDATARADGSAIVAWEARIGYSYVVHRSDGAFDAVRHGRVVRRYPAGATRLQHFVDGGYDRGDVYGIVMTLDDGTVVDEQRVVIVDDSVFDEHPEDSPTTETAFAHGDGLRSDEASTLPVDQDIAPEADGWQVVPDGPVTYAGTLGNGWGYETVVEGEIASTTVYDDGEVAAVVVLREGGGSVSTPNGAFEVETIRDGDILRGGVPGNYNIPLVEFATSLRTGRHDWQFNDASAQEVHRGGGGGGGDGGGRGDSDWNGPEPGNGDPPPGGGGCNEGGCWPA